MEKKTSRAMRSEKTKNTIFEMAIKLFSEYGFDNVKIEDITRKANVSKGTFYTHFDTKESVLVAQFQMIDDNYIKIMEPLPPNMTAVEKLMTLLSAMSRYCSDVCGVGALKVVYINQISPGKHAEILNDQARPLFKYLLQIAKQGLEFGEFQVEMSAYALAEVFGRNMRLCIYDWCLYDGKQALSAIVAEQFDLLLDWLQVESPTAAQPHSAHSILQQQEEEQMRQTLDRERRDNPSFDAVAPTLVSYKRAEKEVVFRCTLDNTGQSPGHYRGMLDYTLETLGGFVAAWLLNGQPARALFLNIHHIMPQVKNGIFYIKLDVIQTSDDEIFFSGICHRTNNALMAVSHSAYAVKAMG